MGEDEERAYEAASRTVEIAEATGESTLWLSSSPHLTRIPDGISALTSLRKLSLFNTAISDLTPLASLRSLRTLELWHTRVADLRVLEQMHDLEVLDLTGVPVIDFSPLGALRKIRYLDVSGTSFDDTIVLRQCRWMRKLRLSRTEIADVSHLSALAWLEGLDISYTEVADIAPLSELLQLAGLNLNGTKISDLRPLARLTNLATDNRVRIGGPLASVETGIDLFGAPLADPYIATIGGPRRARSEAILNRIRQQVGLPPIEEGEPEFEQKSFDFSRLQENLPQSKLGAVFLPESESLRMAASGEQTDLEAASDRVTQQLHAVSRSKLEQLTGRARRIANQPGWEDFGACAQRLVDGMGKSATESADQIGLLWAESVTLGSFLEQDQRIRLSSDGIVAPLEPELRRSLADAVETLGPWLRRFPTARLLDEESASYRHSDTDISLAEAVLRGAERSQSVVSQDIEIIDAALESGERGENQAKKAQSWGHHSVRNIAYAAVGVAALTMVQQISEDLAEKSILANRVEEFLLDSEAELVDFFADLPADMRAAVGALIESIKDTRTKTLD